MAFHILLWNVCPKSLSFWVALINRSLAPSRCIHLIVCFDGSFKRLSNLSILPLGLAFYALLAGVLPSSDVFILSCWLINTWPAGICVQTIYSLTDLFSPFIYCFLLSVGKSRLISNDSSLVKVALSMTKIIVSSSRQRVGERSLSRLEDFFFFREKLIKKAKAFIFSFLVLCFSGRSWHAYITSEDTGRFVFQALPLFRSPMLSQTSCAGLEVDMFWSYTQGTHSCSGKDKKQGETALFLCGVWRWTGQGC